MSVCEGKHQYKHTGSAQWSAVECRAGEGSRHTLGPRGSLGRGHVKSGTDSADADVPRGGQPGVDRALARRGRRRRRGVGALVPCGRAGEGVQRQWTGWACGRLVFGVSRLMRWGCTEVVVGCRWLHLAPAGWTLR